MPKTEAKPATNKPRVQQKPTVKIRAQDLRKFDGADLTPRQRAWCDAVLANNPPGQVLHADAAMIEACCDKAGVKLGP